MLVCLRRVGFLSASRCDFDVAANGPLIAADAAPARLYAVHGNIVDLRVGELIQIEQSGRINGTWHVGAAPTWMIAGKDIIDTGSALGEEHPLYGNYRGALIGGTATSYSNLFVHSHETDVSRVVAGGNILTSSFNVAGPGVLEITAGKSILMNDKAYATSLGAISPGDTRPGAGIVMTAGVGADGLDFAAIRARYLDPENLADPGRPLAEQPGKAAKTYEAELRDWLESRYGFTGTTQEALAYFDGLAPEQQRIFLRGVYFAELREGGREYNNPASSRFGSYLRGREMIATLFPDEDADGNIIEREGDIIMYGGAGVRTQFGGDIQILAPGGQVVVGVEGLVPPATSGLVTQGAGNIQVFSEQSLLLGLSRIMTTFGGDVLAWSEEGDINAGRGAKTTIVYTPPRRVYDAYGNVTLSPGTPSSGAGISTRSSVPGVPGGSVDLLAPLGTIDAGEAGIRSGLDVNIAALHIVNAANIEAQGTTTGVPQVQAPNIGGLTEATNTAGAAAAQAATPAQNQANEQPSITIVEVLGFGGGDSTPREPDEKRQRETNDEQAYNPDSAVQILGHGELTDQEKALLSDEERQKL